MNNISGLEGGNSCFRDISIYLEYIDRFEVRTTTNTNRVFLA